MKRTVLALSTLAAFLFALVPFAAAEWQMNLVTNNTHDNLYVISATWKAADTNKDIPAGFWTRGSYRLAPGKSRAFYSWSTNSIYFRISNAQSALKPQGSSETFPFWVHPDRSFRVVSEGFESSVTADQLLYSDRSSDQLVHSDGFMGYTGGSEVIVTTEWVSLSGVPTAPANDVLGDGDSGNAGETDAVPEWVASVITNATEANLYVVYATWKLENLKKGWPEGFRTRGTYRIRPGKGRVFHAWSDNEIYFRIANAAGALKPEVSSETFGFWLHPRRSFRLVSDQVAATVEQSGLSYSDRSVSKLERSDGFMVYESGSDVTVTSDWVPLAPIDDRNEGNGNGDVAPLPPETPVPPVNPSAPAGMVLIPAGTFQMGSNTGDADESPIHTVSLDAFYMDTHEVTNAEYAAFLNAMGKHENIWWRWVRIGTASTNIILVDGVYRPRAGYENHPVIYIRWRGAMAYARWAGKRLPTEAEWEYAARGGLAGKRYPWGDTIDKTKANYNKPGLGRSMPVGSYPPNGYGLYDMIGNAAEWCLDTYDADYYAKSPTHNPVSLSIATSIQDLLDNYKADLGTYSSLNKYEQPQDRVVRGGDWYDSETYLSVTGRYGYTTWGGSNVFGFRCVKPVTP